MNGILVINKDLGYTSRDVVNIVGKELGTKKVGHTGTLDPMASGVLVLCIGKALKVCELLTNHNKEYIAEITLGIETDTLDMEGNILREENVSLNDEEIIKALNSFVGSYNQEVPKYSAVKINGKKLYEYAREGIEIELPKRDVEIKNIELIDDIEYRNNKTYFNFKCNVSKGTYIRSLIRDIANSLNTIGIMTDLRRTKLGKFKIDKAINIEEINNNKLIDIIDVIDCKKIEINNDIKKQVLNGAIIENIYDCDKILFINDNEAIALYKKYKKDENKLKPYKMFKGGI